MALFIIFTLWFFDFRALYIAGNQFGFNYDYSPNVVGFARELRLFYRLHFFRLVFMLTMFLENPPLKALRRLFTYGVAGATGYMVVATAVNGGDSRFTFFGYENLNTAILLYCVVALFLVLKFKSGTFLNVVAISTMGVFLVETIWEIPYGFVFNYRLGLLGFPYMWFVKVFGVALPIFLWFYIFKRVYRRFLTCFLVAPLVLVITLLTLQNIFQVFGPIHNNYVGFALRFAWASLLIFLPFSQT